MGKRKVTVKQSAADSVARIAWFIESTGMVATAEKFLIPFTISSNTCQTTEELSVYAANRAERQ